MNYRHLFFVLVLVLLVGCSSQELQYTYSFTSDSIIPYNEAELYTPPNATQKIQIIGKVIGTPETKDDASINFFVMTMKNFILSTQGQDFQFLYTELFSNSIYYEEDNLQKYQNEGGLVFLWQNLDLIFGRASRVKYTATVSLQIPNWLLFAVLGFSLCCCCGGIAICILFCGIIGTVIRTNARKHSSSRYATLGSSASFPLQFVATTTVATNENAPND